MIDKDILDGFKEETMALVEELTNVVERLEKPSAVFPSALLEEFSQKIDRVMGSAKTMLTMEPNLSGLKQLAKLAEICKALGYRAAESKRTVLIPFFAAFWADTLEAVQEIVEGLDESGKSSARMEKLAASLQKRLEWLRSKLVAPAQAATVTESAPAEVEIADISQEDIDAMLAALTD